MKRRLLPLLALPLISSACAGGAGSPTSLLGSAFCQTYGCVAVGTLRPTVTLAIDVYALRASPASELRLWREGGRVTAARYVLHEDKDGARDKQRLTTDFFSAAFKAKFTPEDLRGLHGPHWVDGVQVERGGKVFTLSEGSELVYGRTSSDWLVTASLDLAEEARRAGDPWGKKPVLSLLWEARPELHDSLLGLLLSNDVARAEFLKIVEEDRAFVQKHAPVGTRATDAPAFDKETAAFLAEQDHQMRSLFADRYPAFRDWVRVWWSKGGPPTSLS